MPHNKKDFQNAFLQEDDEMNSRNSRISSASMQEECKQNFCYEQEFSKPGYIDVSLIEHPDHLIQSFPNIEVQFNSSNEVCLRKIIHTLKNIGIMLNGCMIFYQDLRNPDTFIYCGNDPIEKPIRISIPLNGQKKVTLKYRSPHGRLSLGETKPPVANNFRRNAMQQAVQHANRQMMDAPKRPKERKIKEVLEYVSKWRRLYQGYYEENGTHTQLPLEVAAQRVGISKKTLDDYLLQIRFGKKFGFNFQENLNNKIGVLRAFVKKERTSEGMGRIYQRYDNQFIDSIADIINERNFESETASTLCKTGDDMSVPDSELPSKNFAGGPCDSDSMMIPANKCDLETFNMDQSAAQGFLEEDEIEMDFAQIDNETYYNEFNEEMFFAEQNPNPDYITFYPEN